MILNYLLDDIITAYPFAFFLSMMIGPVFFILIETSISKGFRAAMVFNTGVIIADIFFILVAYLSSYQLIQKIKDEPSLFIFGGLIMFLYGLITLIQLKKQKIKSETDTIILNKKNYLGLFIKGFLLNFINVGVLGFWLALIITMGPRLEMKTDRIITFFSAVIFFYFTIDLLKIFLAKQLKHKLTPINIFYIKRISSVVLIIFGIMISFQGFFPKEKKILQEKFNEYRK